MTLILTLGQDKLIESIILIAVRAARMMAAAASANYIPNQIEAVVQILQILPMLILTLQLL